MEPTELLSNTLAEHGVNTLEHYGTRGMKWGVRKNLKKLPSSARGDYLKAKDAKWLAKVEANPKLSRVSRIAARDAKRQTKKLKKDYKDRGQNIRKNPIARMRYDNELKVILEQSLDKASYRVHKTSPSRLNEVQIHRHPDGTITATVAARSNAKIVKQFGKLAKADEKQAKAVRKEAAKTVKHAIEDVTDADFVGLEFFLVEDDEGFIDDIITPFDNEMAHDDLDDVPEGLEDLQDTLVHYGIPGMKWGRRKDRTSGGSGSHEPTDVTIKSRPGKIETSGGKNLMPHEDAKKAAAYRQKARSSGVHALSNQELKSLIDRMNLEANYNKALAANPPPKNMVAKFIDSELGQLKNGKKTSTQNIVEFIINADKGYKKHKAAKTQAAKIVQKTIGS